MKLSRYDTKAEPVDADSLAGVDSADGNATKRFTWANLKATIKSYLEGLSSIAFSGSVSAGALRVEVTGTSTLTDAQVRGTLISNYGMGSDGDTTLPAYSGSTVCTVMCEAASQSWSIKPPSGEAFTLDGTALDADDEIDVGQTAGDCLTLCRIRTGASTYAWHAYSVQGTHSDGGAS